MTRTVVILDSPKIDEAAQMELIRGKPGPLVTACVADIRGLVGQKGYFSDHLRRLEKYIKIFGEAQVAEIGEYTPEDLERWRMLHRFGAYSPSLPKRLSNSLYVDSST